MSIRVDSRSGSGAGERPPNSGLCRSWMNSVRTRASDRIVPRVSWEVPYMASTTTRSPACRISEMSMICSMASMYGLVRSTSRTRPTEVASPSSIDTTSAWLSEFASAVSASVSSCSGSEPSARKTFSPFHCAGLWEAVKTMLNAAVRWGAAKVTSGVGTSSASRYTGMPLPAKTSAAASTDSRERKRRSPPTTTPIASCPVRVIWLASAWQSRRTLWMVNPSPISARQPPVPKWISPVSMACCGAKSRRSTMSAAACSSSEVLMSCTSPASTIA